jgi:acetylornithine deacetylase
MDTGRAEDLLAQLVAVDTTSARSNLAAIERLESVLARPGVGLRRFPSPDGLKANLYVRIGPEVDPDTRAGLVLCGHTDCVPAGEPEWTVEPFALTDRGDRWLGRGTADMKGFVALAAALVAETELSSLRAPLCLLFTYDEEVGMHGARELLRQWPAGEALPRACVIGEPTSLHVVRMHKGHVKLRVTLHGKTAHSGTPQFGDNAIEKAGAVVAALRALRLALEEERPEMGEFFPEAPFVPLNVASIAGGVAINVVPDLCALELGFRPLPGADVGALRDRVEKAIHAAVPTATIEPAGFSEPLLTGESSPIYRALCKRMGQTASRGAPFATDGGPLSKLDLDLVVWGPGSIEIAHRADEWLPKADFRRCAELLPGLVDQFCR